jgi:hypothetical protein
MMMTKLTFSKAMLPFIAIAFVLPVLSVNANPQSWTLDNNQEPQAQQQETWLGVSLTPLPEVLSRQLGGVIPTGQGVMIEAVSQGSPAAHAGMQDFDIILSMGDQKIYSAEQLSGLVRAAQPESEVTLKIVRQGKLKDLSVKLDKHAVPTSVGRPWGQHPPMRHQPMPRMMPPMIPPPAVNKGGNHSSKDLAWDSFESVQVQTLANGKYRAEISYKDEKGKTKNFTFEGKREELEGLINKQDGLPQEKKLALLNALNMDSNAMFSQQQWGANFLNEPFFRNGFGNDPFFQRGFPMMPDFNQFFQGFPAAPKHQRQGSTL